MVDFVVQHVTNAEWKIDDICIIDREACDSPPILTPCFSDSNNYLLSVKWQLSLQPDYDRYQWISINLENLTDLKVSATYEISVLNERGFILAKSQVVKGKSENRSSWTVDLFVTDRDPEDDEDQLDLNCLTETFTVLCTISNVRCQSAGKIVDENAISSKVKDEDDNVPELPEHYENLLETGKFSDVTFNIGEKKMQLHKAILTGGSVVFQAMFNHEMKEQNDNVVNVVDVDFDVMKEMFRYIYAKKVNNIDKIATKLFVVADKYSVESLKSLCEKQLIDQLNSANALMYLELAVKYDMVNLKPKVLSFVVQALKEFTGKHEFKNLTSECKDELLNYMSTKTIVDP